MLNGTNDSSGKHEGESIPLINQILICFVVLCFVVGVPINILSLSQLITQHRRQPTRLTILQLNRHLADLLILFIYCPSQVVRDFYRSAPTEYVPCILAKISRNICFQVSTNIILCIALDRYLAVRDIMNLSSNPAADNRRTTIMVIIAWVMAFVLVSPNFGVVKIVSFSFNDGSERKFCGYTWVDVSNIPNYVKTMPPQEIAFLSYHLCTEFILPGIALILIYSSICISLNRHNKTKAAAMKSAARPKLLTVVENDRLTGTMTPAEPSTLESELEDQLQQNAANRVLMKIRYSVQFTRNRSLSSPLTQTIATPARAAQWAGTRAANRAIQKSALIVLVYVACCLPYCIMLVWHMADRDSYKEYTETIAIALYKTILLGPLINPFLYGVKMDAIFERCTSSGSANYNTVAEPPTDQRRRAQSEHGLQNIRRVSLTKLSTASAGTRQPLLTKPCQNTGSNDAEATQPQIPELIEVRETDVML